MVTIMDDGSPQAGPSRWRAGADHSHPQPQPPRPPPIFQHLVPAASPHFRQAHDHRPRRGSVSRNGVLTLPAVCETDEVASANKGSGEVGEPHAATTTSSQSSKRDRLEKQSPSYVLRSGIAGGVAGCVAKTAIAPLDRVKILFQAQNPEFQKYSGHWLGVFRAGREIVRENGVWALFRGHSATLMRIFPYAAIKYMAYDKLHFALMPTRESETAARLFLAGSSSGVLSVFLTYPLELIRVRLAFETKRAKVERGAVRRIIRQIYTEGTTEAPFSGDARRRAAGGGPSSLPPRSSSLHTSAHSSAAQSVTEAQRQALAHGANHTTPVPPAAPSSTTRTTNTLLHNFPIMKFYRGFSVTVLGMVPYAGTSFLVFGRCKRILQDMTGVSDDGGGSSSSTHRQPLLSKTTVDLTSGALAGAISQTAAYPFEVIRRRQQVAAIVRPGAMVGMVETVKWIWLTGGFRGFYTGLSIGFLKVVPMTSIR